MQEAASMSSSPRPVTLSDAELDVLLNLARPLDPAMRDPFLRAVAIELARYQPAELGPGLISRVARQMQREFWSPPRVGGTVRRTGPAADPGPPIP
jgi:hypothetical protein